MLRRVAVLVLALSAQTCFAPLLAQEATGELGLYHQTLVVEGEASVRFFLEGSHEVLGPVGIWGFGSLETTSERTEIGGLAGLYASTGNLSVGVGIGHREVYAQVVCLCLCPCPSADYSESRYAAFAEASAGPLTLEYYYENGRSGESWHKGLAEIRASDLFSFGAITQRGDGAGPKITVHAGPGALWVAPMFSSEGGQRVLLGADLVF